MPHVFWKSKSTCICARGHTGREAWHGCPVNHQLYPPASYLNSLSNLRRRWILLLDSSIHTKILFSLRPDFKHFFTKKLTLLVILQRTVLDCRSPCSGKVGEREPAGATSLLQYLLPQNTGSVWASLCSTSTVQRGSKTVRPILRPGVWWPWPSAQIRDASITGQRWIGFAARRLQRLAVCLERKQLLAIRTPLTSCTTLSKLFRGLWVQSLPLGNEKGFAQKIPNYLPALALSNKRAARDYLGP